MAGGSDDDVEEFDHLSVFTLALHQGTETVGRRDGLPSAESQGLLTDVPVLRVYTSEQALEREVAETEGSRGGRVSNAAQELRRATSAASSNTEQWLGGWSGGQIWESSELLARVLCLQPPSFWSGKRVIELGCGCGVLGLTAAAFSPREVVMTDQVTDVAQWNAVRTYGRIPLFDGPCE